MATTITSTTILLIQGTRKRDQTHWTSTKVQLATMDPLGQPQQLPSSPQGSTVKNVEKWNYEQDLMTLDRNVAKLTTGPLKTKWTAPQLSKTTRTLDMDKGTSFTQDKIDYNRVAT